jgi:hypothetical protein
MNIYILNTGSISIKYWKNILLISILSTCLSAQSQIIVTGSSVKITC